MHALHTMLTVAFSNVQSITESNIDSIIYYIVHSSGFVATYLFALVKVNHCCYYYSCVVISSHANLRNVKHLWEGSKV